MFLLGSIYVDYTPNLRGFYKHKKAPEPFKNL